MAEGIPARLTGGARAPVRPDRRRWRFSSSPASRGGADTRPSPRCSRSLGGVLVLAGLLDPDDCSARSSARGWGSPTPSRRSRRRS